MKFGKFKEKHGYEIEDFVDIDWSRTQGYTGRFLTLNGRIEDKSGATQGNIFSASECLPIKDMFSVLYSGYISNEQIEEIVKFVEEEIGLMDVFGNSTDKKSLVDVRLSDDSPGAYIKRPTGILVRVETIDNEHMLWIKNKAYSVYELREIAQNRIEKAPKTYVDTIGPSKKKSIFETISSKLKKNKKETKEAEAELE